MSIYKTAINKPVTTILIFVAVAILGLFSLSRLPIDQFPEMEPPYVTVMTTYAGANASEIETNVTKMIENSLSSVDGLKEMTSTSKDNMSMVLLEMEWGQNLDEVINDIRSFLDIVRDRLPDGCSNPMILKFSSSSMPIAQYAITAKESYPGLDKILNDDVIPQLNMVDGIGNISLSGSPERYIYLDLDQAKLDAYGLSLEQVSSAVSSNNLNLSSGTIKINKEQYAMQVRSEYLESEDIKHIVVSTTPTGRQVFVKDLAIIRDTLKDLSLDEKINSQEGVRMMVTKQTGGNTVQICKELNEELAKIEKRLPSDINIEIIYDSSDEIKNSINSLEESIFYALLFVVLVVLFFLGRWRATFIIGITIPIALIVSFIYLMLVDSSINIISLCSLTVAIGMVVDDAIVVLENITKHIERGANPREASIYATNEVWVSVIATTLVIVVVFVPLTMLSGMAGILFKELGWLVTIVVCTSTVCAITLTPMLCSKLLKAKKVQVDEHGHLINLQERASWYEKYVVGFLNKVDSVYANVLRVCLKNKKKTLFAAFVIFAITLLPMIMGKIGSDFMQQTDNGRLTVTVELQRGTRIEETIKTARRLEARFRELVPEIRMISSSAGSNDNAGIGALFSQTTNNKISMTVVCTKKYQRERTIFNIAEVLRQELAQYPEIITYQCSTGGGMMGGSATVDIEVYGHNFDQTNMMTQEIRQMIRNKIAGARDIKVSRDEDRAELKLTIDKEKASLHGLNSATISTYVRNRINGSLAGYLKEDGDEYDIIVRLKEENRNSITDIEDMTIPTPTGKQIKLSEVSQVEEYWAPPTIERKSRQRVVTIKVTPYQVSLGEMAQQIEKELDQMNMPTGVTYRISGSYEDQQESFGDIGILLALIVLLVYVVMASQFESFSKPAIIMMSVPFAFSGTVLALWLTGTSLDMIGALGIVMLVGIVVKNGIVLVDYINLMRDRGYELNEAIALSGQSRLRPVLMTAFTTILGMVPMAISQGEGSEMWQPLGIVVIGGLLISTLVTLIIVPIFYALLSRHGERDKEAMNRKQFIFMQLAADEAETSTQQE